LVSHVDEPIGGKYIASSFDEFPSSELQLHNEVTKIKSNDIFFIAKLFLELIKVRQ
jgi:hypothetical protein